MQKWNLSHKMSSHSDVARSMPSALLVFTAALAAAATAQQRGVAWLWQGDGCTGPGVFSYVGNDGGHHSVQ